MRWRIKRTGKHEEVKVHFLPPSERRPTFAENTARAAICNRPICGIPAATETAGLVTCQSCLRILAGKARPSDIYKPPPPRAEKVKDEQGSLFERDDLYARNR